MPIDFSMCKKHGAVRHTVTSTCNLCASEQAESQITDIQQLKDEISNIADEVAQMSYVHHTEQDFTSIINGLRKLSEV